ncbi:MAG: orotidine-5'-phosphate decarboxylase [Bacteroidetes bacterium]|nr:orotidine-5'-phosphate decarboxylase [Bacteroidota bacterium]
MTQEALFEQIKFKKSFLCVGLDIDLDKVPTAFQNQKEGLFEFAKAIIDATHPYAVAYKPNLAFYEIYGVKGWEAFEKTMQYLNTNYPNHFTIADAKRGDIGNTATRYAKAFFERYGVDSVTVAPYMGRDSVEPFLAFPDKHTILLALTSNEGAQDFQYSKDGDTLLYEKVIQESQQWKHADRLMYVVGATKAEALASLRKLIPNAFLLVPGVGAQGGSLQEVAAFGLNAHCGLLVNSSRSILYASQQEDFAQAAANEAQKLKIEMEEILVDKGIL